MRYAPDMYAHAFAESLKGNNAVSENIAIERLIALVTKNGDGQSFDKIVEAIEKKIVQENGGKMVLIEFARPVSANVQKELTAKFSEADSLSIRHTPELVAGTRITINGEQELDYTMRRKLKTLFAGA